MITIGIDPDTQATSIAVLKDGEIAGLLCIKNPYKATGLEAARLQVDCIDDMLGSLPVLVDDVDAAAIEYQQNYASRRDRINQVPPDKLALLTFVTGGMYSALASSVRVLLIPTPREWKGSVKKPAHQARTLYLLGIEPEKMSTYARPKDAKLRKELYPGPVGDWKHLTDAIGLAVWAAAEASR